MQSRATRTHCDSTDGTLRSMSVASAAFREKRVASLYQETTMTATSKALVKRPPKRSKNNPYGISPEFKERADSAAFYEAWVGAVLARAGLFTLHHPFTIAKDVTEVPNYHQTWDLEVGQSPLPEDCVQVEVKSVNLTFLNTDTYPFEDLLICSLNSWDRKWPKSTKTMRDFLFVSRVTGTILWLPVGSPMHVGETYDAVRGQLYKTAQTKSEYLRPLSDFVVMVRG